MDKKLTNYAISSIYDSSNNCIGTVKFSQKENDKTTVVVQLKGLDVGEYSCKIHEYGNLSNGIQSTGQQLLKSQEQPNSSNAINHKIFSDGVNECYEVFEDSNIELSGALSSIGRAFVLENISGIIKKENDIQSEKSSKILNCYSGVIGFCAPFDSFVSKL